MNINDFQAPPLPPSWYEVLQAIFRRQMELVEKYQAIEQLPSPPVSLHTQHGNRIIRDFAWRTIEELAESYEAWGKHKDQAVAEQHALEELADATHFWIELLMFAGVEAYTLRDTAYPEFSKAETFDTHYWYVTFKIGIAMNFLRNKAWKTSQVPTDEARFRAALLEAHQAMIELWAFLGYDSEVLWAFYMKKSEVNKFRQRTQY